jgi:hypothetical protein
VLFKEEPVKLEIFRPDYENPTLEDQNDEILVSNHEITTEDAGRIAGRLVMIGIAYNTGVVMPGAELATLEAALVATDTAEAVKFRENAQQN